MCFNEQFVENMHWIRRERIDTCKGKSSYWIAQLLDYPFKFVIKEVSEYNLFYGIS